MVPDPDAQHPAKAAGNALSVLGIATTAIPYFSGMLGAATTAILSYAVPSAAEPYFIPYTNLTEALTQAQAGSQDALES